MSQHLPSGDWSESLATETNRTHALERTLDLESGLDALRASPTFRGPVESLDGHDANEHIAQFYESREEQLAAAVPFIQQGFERGERCIYVVEDGEVGDVRDAMLDAGVDVGAAIESGALEFRSVRETYLRTGTFDPDDMIDLYADAIEDTPAEYAGLRVIANTTWILDDSTTIAKFMEYEAKVNDLFEGEDCIALCQYDRQKVPADVLSDVVQTHPHIIYDSTVCHNFYHTPPEEYLEPDQPSREVERMLRTLLDRTHAKTTLEEREALLHSITTVTSSPDRSFQEKLQALFELGCEQFDLELGAMAYVDVDDDWFEVEYVSREHEHFVPGVELPLSETYCTAATEIRAAGSVSDPVVEGYDDITVYQEFGIRAYLGTYIGIEYGMDRTFFFVSSERRDEPFPREAFAFLRLMGQWVKYELEREQREDRLAALNALSRELINAETDAEVSGCVIEAAGRLKIPITAIARYDEEEGGLRIAKRTEDASDLSVDSLLERDGGIGWEAFVTNESRRVSGPPNEREKLPSSVTELIALPLDSYGLFIVASTAQGGFSPSGRDFIETVAANVTAGLDRANRERQLHEREDQLKEQNETLERLNRINSIIRSIDKSLVQAVSREEIEAVVCDRLTGDGPYELAWIGDHDVITDEVTPRAWAGDENGYLDTLRDAEEDDDGVNGEPTNRAVNAREPKVIDDVLADPPLSPWRRRALNHGYHSVAALPLAYKGTLYGVLAVYVDRSGVFDELEQEVLTELSDTIAYAINAVESKKALVSNEITELEFEVSCAELGAIALTNEIGCAFSTESVVPRMGGGFRVIFSTRGANADEVLAFEPQLPVERLTLITECEEGEEAVCLFEGDLTEASLVQTVLEHGGRPTTITAEEGSATVTVELASDADVREFTEMFQCRYSDADLVAQRTHERPRRTITEFHATLTDELTDRQLEVLQTAYFSGYFEKPRAQTGSEIAEVLDITQPTFNSHLRASQRKLFGRLFDETSIGE